MANKPKITQVVILSAGLGTRLKPLTDSMPKVMVPLAGKPLLLRHIELFKKHGVTEFFINLHYLPEVIDKFFGDGSAFGVNITYAYEPKILGTAGGIKNFEGRLGNDFFVIYGDTFYEMNFGNLISHYAGLTEAIGLGTIRQTDHPWDSDLAVVDDGGRVVEFHKKPHKELPANSRGMSAPYIFSKKILEFIPGARYYELDHDLIPDLLSRGFNYHAYKLPEGEIRKDIGTPERYEEVQKYLAKSD